MPNRSVATPLQGLMQELTVSNSSDALTTSADDSLTGLVKTVNASRVNTSGNTSSAPEVRFPPMSTDDILYYTYSVSCVLLISLVGIVGNVMVILAMLRHRKQLLRPPNYFILSLAVSDLSLALLYPLYNISHIETRVIYAAFGCWHYCSTISTLVLAALYTSSYSLVGITVSRFICVQNALRAHLILTPPRALAAVVTTWCVSCALSMVLHMRVTPIDLYSPNETCRYELVFSVHHVIFNAVFPYMIPIVVMVTIYSHISGVARRKIEDMQRIQLSVMQVPVGWSRRIWLLRKELRLFGTAGLLIGYFALAWTPYITFEFISLLNDSMYIDQYIRSTVRILLHSNTAVNMLIYAGRMPEFRRAILRDKNRLCQKVCRH